MPPPQGMWQTLENKELKKKKKKRKKHTPRTSYIGRQLRITCLHRVHATRATNSSCARLEGVFFLVFFGCALGSPVINIRSWYSFRCVLIIYNRYLVHFNNFNNNMLLLSDGVNQYNCYSFPCHPTMCSMIFNIDHS